MRKGHIFLSDERSIYMNIAILVQYSTSLSLGLNTNRYYFSCYVKSQGEKEHKFVMWEEVYNACV